jgi:hypothetical protein
MGDLKQREERMKTSELEGPALDWAVSKCEGVEWEQGDLDAGEYGPGFMPTTNWSQGGPIIEREVITLIHPRWDGWTAHKYDDRIEDESYTVDGPTPLIAAMRCYVASVLGDTVDIPEELK